jgi:hypothetical protein
VNGDFPVDLLRAIDREARRIGVTRQTDRKDAFETQVGKAAAWCFNLYTIEQL